MLEWLLETAISYGIEWLIDTVVDEAGNIIYNLITDNDGLTDALVECSCLFFVLSVLFRFRE